MSGTCRLRLTIIAFGEKERHYRPLMIVWLLIYHFRKPRDIITLQIVVGEVFKMILLTQRNDREILSIKHSRQIFQLVRAKVVSKIPPNLSVSDLQILV